MGALDNQHEEHNGVSWSTNYEASDRFSTAGICALNSLTCFDMTTSDWNETKWRQWYRRQQDTSGMDKSSRRITTDYKQKCCQMPISTCKQIRQNSLTDDIQVKKVHTCWRQHHRGSKLYSKKEVTWNMWRNML